MTEPKDDLAQFIEASEREFPGFTAEVEAGLARRRAEVHPCPICGPKHRGTTQGHIVGVMTPVETTLEEEYSWALSAAAAEADFADEARDALVAFKETARRAIVLAWRSGYLAAQEDARTGEDEDAFDIDPDHYLAEAAEEEP